MKKRVLRMVAGLLSVGTLLSFTSCFETNKSETTSETAKADTAEQVYTERTDLLTTAEFRQNGTDLTCSIRSMNAVFDFSDRITVSKKSTWTLSDDASGNNTISSKSVTLTEGDNTYYITVVYREERKVYKATVNYAKEATVTFYANTENAIPAQKLTPGKTATKPQDPERAGYTFKGWFYNGTAYDFATPVTGDITLVAHWTALSTAWVYDDTDVLHYTDTSAVINVVWKDYANLSGLRPASVTCVLTETDGTDEKSYPVTVTETTVSWENGSPEGAVLTKGAGNWTVKITGLSNEKQYTFKQSPLSHDYTTQQSGTSAVNTVSGYVPSVDTTAALTTRNARLYDAAGNVVTLHGIVTWNVNVDGFDTLISEASLTKLKATGVNCIRVTVQLVGVSGVGYVYHTNGSGRTGDYSDDKDERTTANYQEKIISSLNTAIRNATLLGMYTIVDWGILTSDPNQYTNEAKQFFTEVAKSQKDNPYVLYEICNEPQVSGTNGWADIKSYGEELIATLRNAGVTGVIIQAANSVTTHISNKDGYDPIHDPFDDDTAYNVAYSFHCYPGNYVYETTSEYPCSYTYGWRLKDAVEAGCTIIVTEVSPVDGTFQNGDPLSFDFGEMAKYLRLFREYDMGICYFRGASSSGSTYNESYLFLPGVNLAIKDWTRDDLTECGKWFYDLITGDGVLTAPDYTAHSMKLYRENYKTIYNAYGLSGIMPGFATDALETEGGWFFRTGKTDTLSTILYTEYCRLLVKQITGIKNNNIRVQNSTSVYRSEMLPTDKTGRLEATYAYNGTDYNVTVSYGENTATGTWGVFVSVTVSQ